MSIKELIRNKILSKRTKVQKKKFNYKFKILHKLNNLYQLNSFGKKNKNKIFYVIKRSPGGGMFSNLNYVVNHLLIAEKFNFIPIIDMENFPTFYNENSKIFKSYNAWDYYFENFNKIKLTEVYESKYVIFSEKTKKPNIYFDGFNNLNKEHLKITKKYIKIKKYIIDQAKNFTNKNFKGKKILGVHFRGSDQKTQERHPFPATINQIIFNVSELLQRYKFDKVFLVTEELNYQRILKKEFGDRLIFFDSFLSNQHNIFDQNIRKSHRYKIGKENIINMLCLSESDHLLCAQSNLAEAALFFSNKNIKTTKIKNGFNSNNIFFAQILWYIKKSLPSFMGGFKLKHF